MIAAKNVIEALLSLQNEEKSRVYQRFFKTNKGDYGEGDLFLGVTNPLVRKIAKEFELLNLTEVHTLLQNEWHEIRLCGILILVNQFEKLSKPKLVFDADAIKKRDKLIIFYLENTERINNWDLVDLSVYKILGHWLLLPTFLGSKNDTASMSTGYKINVLDKLASSSNLWEQRMSIVCTWWTNNKNEPSWCIKYSQQLLSHPHDLIHKAVGWMLREMGKHCGMPILRNFLETHYAEMSRTTLRYAIERMDSEERKKWLMKQ